MNFYTYVLQWGNQLLVREVKNGQRINHRVSYKPTLFSPVREQTGYKTLAGTPCMPTKFDSIKEAKSFVESYKSQPELVLGNTQYSYTYISDNYKNDIEWDLDKILIVTLDIETQCENGFPNPQLAEEEMLAITIKNHQNKKLVVWGLHEYENKRDDVTYILCKDEED